MERSKTTQNDILLQRNDKLLKQFRLQVKSELESLLIVLQWFEKIVKPLLPNPVGWQCQIALIEGFTNTVRHAHQDLPPTTPIDLEVNLFESWLEMRIWDWGNPFDLQAKLRSLCPTDHQSLEKEGGRGLYFMQQLTDELHYIRTPTHRNCLILRRRLGRRFTHQD